MNEIPVQKGLDGFPDKILATIKQGILAMYHDDPEIVINDRLMVIEYWRRFCNFEEFLKTCPSFDEFAQWYSINPNHDTITRAKRELNHDEQIHYDDKTAESKRLKQMSYRDYYRRKRGGV